MVVTTRAGSKRRRTSPDTLGIDDLPDLLLSHVSEYLVKTSRAFFAAALTAPPSSSRLSPLVSAASRAIISPHSSEQFDILDFGEIEKIQAEKLSDDDVCAILACINAKATVKTLKLTGCTNITGCGLEPIRESTVIEQIDLSLVKQHELPILEPEPLMSPGEVLPILSSIVQSPGSSLKLLELPKHFFSQDIPLLNTFLGEYDQLLNHRGASCSNCDGICPEDDDNFNWVFHNGHQNYTCYACTRHFCLDCELLFLCETCGKEYCKDCVDMKMCSGCCKDYCRQCTPLNTCSICLRHFCCHHESFRTSTFDRLCCENGTCCTDCRAYNICCNADCDRENCEDCYDGKQYDVDKCSLCWRTYCFECMCLECHKDWEHFCPGCMLRMIHDMAEGYRENEMRAGRRKGLTEAPENFCHKYRRKEGCTKDHCGGCGHCQDKGALHCARCHRCQKEGCQESHCQTCGVCDIVNVSHCDDCHVTKCTNCQLDILLTEYAYDVCDGCIKGIFPSLLRGCSENHDRED